MTTASIIKDQIGGKALFMLGAKNLLDHGDALSFRIRGSKAVNAGLQFFRDDSPVPLVLAREPKGHLDHRLCQLLLGNAAIGKDLVTIAAYSDAAV